MNLYIVRNFNDFVNSLLVAGFSMGGGNSEGIFSVVPWSWDEEPPYDTPVRWHTGDPETDPWEWRIRVLEERDDIAYAKLFFRKRGYITREWYPYFLAIRRDGRDFEEEYNDGLISNFARRIYDVVKENGALPFHIIKHLGGFSREDNSKFEKALIDLQMKMYLTMCGRQPKISRKGEEYGWASTVFCTVEEYFGENIIDEAGRISEQEAINRITDQIYRLNPDAELKKIMKFIRG